MINQDAIIGHQNAIANLKKSIAERDRLIATATYITPSFLPVLHKIHVTELDQLQVLELELQAMQKL